MTEGSDRLLSSPSSPPPPPPTLGGSFEWAEDFPLLPPPGPPLCFSRFSVSPALETPGPPARAPDARPAGTVLQTLGPAPRLPISVPICLPLSCPHLSEFLCLSPSFFLLLSVWLLTSETPPTSGTRSDQEVSIRWAWAITPFPEPQFPFCKDPL